MHRELEIKYIDNDDPRKNVDYIQTIEELNNYNEITGIIIPEKTDELSNYNYEKMIDQIRTDPDKKIARLPIYLVDDEVLDEVLDEEEWKIKYNNIGVVPRKTSGSRHDQANKWGVYRLLKFLNEFSGPNEEVVKYKKELSNFDLFYKKKINEELLTESKTAEIKIDVEKLVKEIKKSMKKVVLVDDQANYGWDDAYSLIFGTNVVKSFSTANDFRDSKKKWDTYDLVLLDLRLEENENKRRSVLSGNELLVEIKNKIPEVPVIIVTASNKYNNLRDSLDSGANDYWVKESYELGVSKAYNIENSEKLLESIKKCLKWNKEIRPIIEVLNNIERNLRSIKKRKDFISNYLFISSFNDFIDAKLKSTTLEAIYLAAYSIINEIGSYYFKEKRIDVVDDVLDDEEDIYSEIKVIEFDNGVESEPFAYNKKEKDKNKWKTDYSEKIPDDVVNEKVTLDNNKTCYLIYKANPNSYKEPLNIFKTLRKKRNNLQLTHRNFNDPRANAVGLNDIKQLVNLLNETVATLG